MENIIAAEPIIINLAKTYECPIAIQPFIKSDHEINPANSRVFTLVCGHSYGQDIITYVASGGIKNCPMCREPIEKAPARNCTLECALKDLDDTCSQLQILSNNNFVLQRQIVKLNKEIDKLKSDLEVERSSDDKKKVEELSQKVESLTKENVVYCQKQQFRCTPCRWMPNPKQVVFSVLPKRITPNWITPPHLRKV